MRTSLCLLVCVVSCRALGGAAAAPEVIALGSYASSLRAPSRIAADPAGRLYVTDATEGRVVVFDAFGRPVTVRAGFERPLGIAIGRSGRVMVAEERTGSVSVFDADWNRLYSLGTGRGEFQLPNHLAIDLAAASDAVYVSDSRANVVRLYVDGERRLEFGQAGTGDGCFAFPAGLCLSTDGALYVVDQGNDRIQVFDRAGRFLRAFPLRLPGAGWGPSGRSQAVAVDQAGRLYVADGFQGTVKVFDAASGTLLSSVGHFGTHRGELSMPVGLVLDAFGRLCVASANNGRVEVYGVDSFVHVTTSPAAEAVAVGSPLRFAAAGGGPGPLVFQWLKNGQPLDGATGATLSFQAVTAADSGGYSVRLIGPAGTLTSSVAQVAVVDPPAILTNPHGGTVVRGAAVPLSVTPAGTELSYQWQLNGRSVPGATNRTLELTDVQPAQAGAYSVIVSNRVGLAVSEPAALNVVVPPSIAEILSSSITPDRTCRLTLNADPSYGYSIDASTDLLRWQSLTNFTHQAGLFEYTDADSAGFWLRFYRLRWVP